MQTFIDLPFANGTYRFRLTLPGIVEIQRATGAGIGAVFARLIRGRYRQRGSEEHDTFGLPNEGEFHKDDLLETIRQGLIGGGMGWVDGVEVPVSPLKANELLLTYCFPARPINEAWTLATAILTVAMTGYEPPDAKKKSPTKPSVTPKAKGGSKSRKSSPTSPSQEEAPQAGAI